MSEGSEAPEPQETSAPAPAESAAEPEELPAEPDERLAELEVQLGERTADLQRLQAEYVNYKRRVDRDRQAVRDNATVGVLMALLPVLDDIDRAREHGELAGGFKAVAESLGSIVTVLGLERFGEAGEPFDPRIHEALLHEYSDSVAEPTAATVLQPGYRLGERVVRPARVAVAEPELPAPSPQVVEDESAADSDAD